MAVTKEYRQTTLQNGPETTTTKQVNDPRAEQEHHIDEEEYHRDVRERVVWYVVGVVEALLGLRFLFALLGANSASGIGSLVYGITYPLVAPFFGLFGYNYTAGRAHFESYTLVAMVIYALIGLAIARLFKLRSRRAEV